MRTGWIIAGGTGLALGLGLASQVPNAQEHALDANLYMQTSAEYRAVCLQTYNWAGERLAQRLATRPVGAKRPAVVMDMDETVIDNAAFQSYLDKANLSYSDAEWERYERDFASEVRLIPGAKSFVDRARSMGVAVVFLSNRMAKYKQGAIKSLELNGIQVPEPDDTVLLKESTSDKTARRAKAAEKFDVVMLVGDNLRDFSEEFVAPRLDYKEAVNRAQGMNERWSKVEANAHRFGAEWIILPNTVYGEWQRVLGPDGRLNLRETKMAPTKGGNANGR